MANQVVQRDRHAALLCAVAVLGGTLEKIALEIRHLQRTEVREAEEPFGEGQKGSSAMPHKRNPVSSERVCGLSRLLRAYAHAALEDQALWHERDISHSSVERVILPDAFLVADFITHDLGRILRDLRVYPEHMLRNLEEGGGLVHSQRVLLALTAAGWSRDEAYRLVQRTAMAALDGGGSFRGLLEAEPKVRETLGPETLAACFDLEPYLANVDVLLIDEMGYLNLKPEQTNIFFKLMEERYRRRPTIITTNLDYSEWASFLGNKALVEALISRLRHQCHTVKIDGPSLRDATG